uniref:NADH dehydrogenase subunit 6 n=1 Tax=Erythrolobus coxiae TaxID=362235 RepID=UPI001FCDE955|nr:NADH dehydrogenase subunit 6 [Erythrolobus coxiae]UNJ19007.1 NADH dehydrogenase subunit 6 [Erythrolobus coxiae]
MNFLLQFYYFTGISFFTCCLVFLSVNSVYSILFLIILFFNVCIFILYLGNEFLSLLVLIVYVGAVLVIFTFIIMMLNVRFILFQININSFFFILFKLNLFFLLMFHVIFSLMEINFQNFLTQYFLINIDLINTNWNVYISTSIQVLGNLLYTNYVSIFLMSGIVLFIAMINVIYLTLNQRVHTRKQSITLQLIKLFQNCIQFNVYNYKLTN